MAPIQFASQLYGCEAFWFIEMKMKSTDDGENRWLVFKTNAVGPFSTSFVNNKRSREDITQLFVFELIAQCDHEKDSRFLSGEVAP